MSASASHAELELIALSNRDVVVLGAEEIVQIMRRVGFSDKQILEFGTDMRNGLARSGAVQVRTADANKAEAIFAVNGDCVYISSRLRGSFIYNVKTGWVPIRRNRS